MEAACRKYLYPSKELKDFVRKCWPVAYGSPRGAWESMTGDGSDRVFMRVRGDQGGAGVLVYGPDPAENRSYENIGRHLWRVGRYGPEFFGADQERGLFLVEDLGDLHLQAWAQGMDRESLTAMYIETTVMLADVHERASAGFDPDWCHQTRQYDRELILDRETGYFEHSFLRGHLGMLRSSSALKKEFEGLADRALDGTGPGFMHRDCQSRNIMIKDGKPRLIDFQGARLGPSGYDLASLLYDPYIKPDAGLRTVCLEQYQVRRLESGDFDRDSFIRTWPFLAVCRLLQALGAYAFLSGVRGKTQFLQYIPTALDSLGGLLSNEKFAFMPELRRLVLEMGRGRENST